MPILTKIRNSLLSTTGAPTARQTRSQKMSKKIWKSSLSQTSSLLFILGQTFSITLRQSRVCPTANTVLQIHKYKNTNKSTNTKIQQKYKHNYKLKCKYNCYFHPQAPSLCHIHIHMCCPMCFCCLWSCGPFLCLCCGPVYVHRCVWLNSFWWNVVWSALSNVALLYNRGRGAGKPHSLSPSS